MQDFKAECRAESVDYTIAAGDSLIQWLVIPRLGKIMHEQPAVRFATSNLRTNEIVQQVKDGRVDFGVIRKDAVVAPLRSAPLGSLNFVVVVPKSFVPARGSLSMRDVLGRLPFAAHTSDGQFTQKLRDVAKALKAELRPALTCQSFPQAVAAVRSGGFGAVLPSLALQDLEPDLYCEISAAPLARLSRNLVLVWNARLPQVRPAAQKLAIRLQEVLRF